MDTLIITSQEELQSLLSSVVRNEFAAFQPSGTPTKQEPEFLTRKQTAERLKVSLVTLHQWTKTGVIQGYRIAGRVRYKSTEVESSLQAMQTIKNRG